MNLFVRKFSQSLGEFRSLRNLTMMAMLLAMKVALSFFTIQPLPSLKIGFSFLALAVAGMMFGPSVGFLLGAAGDIISFVIKPTGAFNPAMTLIAALGGLIWGLALYKNQCTLPRVIIGKTCITVICNLLLTTLVLSLFFGQVFNEIFPLRLVKNLCTLPVEILLATIVCKAVSKIEARVRRPA
ncbi:MAG: folate family ECF transporter S component [Oscillospiraceae bacterium]|jgi:ECF transporter S component (folate family)